MFKTEKGFIKIFTDGGNLDSIIKLSKDPNIDGITTNPSLLRKSKVTNYMRFAKLAVKASNGKPISLEVLSDNHEEMINQALKLHNLGNSVYVKIPITNSQGLSSRYVIKYLLNKNIPINITAILCEKQMQNCLDILGKDDKSFISIFAGRVADTGKDPIPLFKKFREQIDKRNLKYVKLIWASTREVFNVYQAINCKCDIITLSPEIIKKLHLKDYDLEKLSLETIKMFKKDSDLSNFVI